MLVNYVVGISFGSFLVDAQISHDIGNLTRLVPIACSQQHISSDLIDHLAVASLAQQPHNEDSEKSVLNDLSENLNLICN